MKNFCRIASLALFSVLSAVGQSQTVKAVLNISDPLDSVGVTLAQGRDGRLYGMSSGFASTQNPDGTFFRVNPDGSAATVLFPLSGTNGQKPIYGVTLAADGNYYGTTIDGGTSNLGVLFKVSPTGVYTVLLQFGDGSNGVLAAGPPIQASDGNLYGATENTVYRYSPSTGQFTTVFTLSADGSQGNGISAPLIQAADGSLYGTTQVGGVNNCGTIINLNTSGVLLHAYSFSCGAGERATQPALSGHRRGLLWNYRVGRQRN